MTSLGNLYVIAAPSGTGKTSLVGALIDTLDQITVSISYTTRKERGHEQHGLHYHFVSQAEFEKMIIQGDFLEYALVFEHYYGTSKSWVMNKLTQGIDVILEIDWQGYQQIKDLFPEVIGIFILPPSITELRERLLKRNQDPLETIQKRLADAKVTMSHLHEFDYAVFNRDFITALNDLKTIIKAGRLSQKRQSASFARLLNEYEQI